ncbi:MAG TPA: amidohydrolase family protein [Steroidobacteraceae bacterium]|nr:amidohydrolase family protein [Steroidobacteraceae bacterium]
MGKVLLKDCKYLIAQPERREILRGVSVLIDGAEIIAVGSAGDLTRMADYASGLEAIDCRHKLVMPGLVNGHNHSPWSVVNLVFSGARGTGVELPERTDTLQAIEDYMLAPMAWFTADSTYDLAMCGLMDQIRYGTTTTADANNHPDALYRAAVDSGIRSVIQPQMLTNIIIDGLDGEGYLAQTAQCIRDYHIGGSDRITVAVHPNYPWNCSESLLIAGMDLAEQYDVQYATHLFELASEREQADRMWSERGGAMNYLQDIGLLKSRTVLFHGIDLDDAEIDTLAIAGCALVHSPELQAELLGRVANVPRWLKTGMNVALGTDYGQFDMFTAMKLAGLLPRLARGAAPLDPWDLLRIATIGGARCLWLDRKTGTIEAGKRADIITIDLSRSSGLIPMCDDDDWIASLLTRQSTRMPVTDSMVDGRFLRRDGQFTFLDEVEIVGRAQAWCQKFASDYRQMLESGRFWHRKIYPMFTP